MSRGPPTPGYTHIPQRSSGRNEALSNERNRPDVLPQGKRGRAGRVRVKAGAWPLARWAFRLFLLWAQRGTVGRQHMGLALAGQGVAGAGSLWAQDTGPVQPPAHLP